MFSEKRLSHVDDSFSHVVRYVFHLWWFVITDTVNQHNLFFYTSSYSFSSRIRSAFYCYRKSSYSPISQLCCTQCRLLSVSAESHTLRDVLLSAMCLLLPCISGTPVPPPAFNKFLKCLLCPNRLCTDNNENLFVGDVCELVTTKRQKDFYNNNTKSQCKSQQQHLWTTQIYPLTA